MLIDLLVFGACVSRGSKGSTMKGNRLEGGWLEYLVKRHLETVVTLGLVSFSLVEAESR